MQRLQRESLRYEGFTEALWLDGLDGLNGLEGEQWKEMQSDRAAVEGGHVGLCRTVSSECSLLPGGWPPTTDPGDLFPPSDIYAIGVGKLDVDWRELNDLASKKDGERHAFILQDAKALHQVFEHMLGK